jgi:hypothetical protein
MSSLLGRMDKSIVGRTSYYQEGISGALIQSCFTLQYLVVHNAGMGVGTKKVDKSVGWMKRSASTGYLNNGGTAALIPPYETPCHRACGSFKAKWC